MEEIQATLLKNRPNLSNSSVRTYASTLKNLYKKVFPQSDIKMSKYNDTEAFLQYLRSVPPNQSKTALSALYVLTENQDYRTMMMNKLEEYGEDIKKQVKTPKQEKNWATQEQVDTLLQKHRKLALQSYKKDPLTAKDLQTIQDYILLVLYSGKYIPVRRSVDYHAFKIRNIDKSKDNYLDKGKFVFQQYKTAKTYGKQTISISRALQSILKRWISVNPTDFLLFNTKNEALTSVTITQRLNKIFGQAISVNALRHLYLTSRFGHTIAINQDLEDTMKDMGSSMNMSTTYIKK